MNAPESVVSRIRSLSLKTVANGATESEEIAAKEMVAKLVEKYGLDNHFSKKPSTHKPQQKSSLEIVQTFKERYSLGTIEKHVNDMDWDVIAKEMLGDYEYTQYLQMTHKHWEAYNKTIRGLQDASRRIYLDTYRKHCYKVFMHLHK